MQSEEYVFAQALAQHLCSQLCYTGQCYSLKHENMIMALNTTDGSKETARIYSEIKYPYEVLCIELLYSSMERLAKKNNQARVSVFVNEGKFTLSVVYWEEE